MKYCTYCQKQILVSNPAFNEDVCNDEVCMNHAFEEERVTH